METRLHAQQKTAPAPWFKPVRGGMLQRKCACGGSAGMAGACEECSSKRLSLQRSTRNSERETQNSGTVPSIVNEVLRSPGQPLDAETRAFMEPRFGHDFSQVHVHTDSKAAESAQAINALAYTVGRDVAFGAGQFAPHLAAGQKLLAHELTHTIQQSGDLRSSPATLEVTHPNDSTEREAVQASEMAMTGRALLQSQGSGLTIARETAAPADRTSPPPPAVPDVFVHSTELGGLSVGNFDFHFRNCAILVWVWVKFQFTKDINPIEQQAFKQRFVNAVHSVWAHTGYSLSGGERCPCGTVPIEIHVEENTKSYYHKLVDVERQTDVERRPKVISDININFETPDETIAHEFGHVLGLYDEYDGGFFENIMFWHKNQDDPKALMSSGSELRPRYFEHYRKEVQASSPKGCQYAVSSPTPPVP